MKALLSALLLLFTLSCFAQSPAEKEVLKLSADFFKWEVGNNTDSVEHLLDAHFIAGTSSGQTQDKQQYLAVLKGGKVTHNNIDVEESAARVVGNTATVTGKGKFTLTVNGTEKIVHLSYLEVFIREKAKSPWKMLALHAGLLNN